MGRWTNKLWYYSPLLWDPIILKIKQLTVNTPSGVILSSSCNTVKLRGEQSLEDWVGLVAAWLVGRGGPNNSNSEGNLKLLHLPQHSLFVSQYKHRKIKSRKQYSAVFFAKIFSKKIDLKIQIINVTCNDAIIDAVSEGKWLDNYMITQNWQLTVLIILVIGHVPGPMCSTWWRHNLVLLL